ncbi:hypothetical protein AALP_AA5G074800 [Arabis alpina]|uniref:Wall-associated receptor kinase C-terminal domain-containing protein n=1 Tax=Arabis alpina TaxID=50452 RepID=A0A087GVJ2_ARAAL|nr:hypothetical protein AALP_AA5G074800 [Arabis alpina]
MQENPRKIHLLLLFFLIFSPSTQNQEDQEPYYCGKTKISDPFLSIISNQSSNITCRSGKLYFKTSIGLIHVSSIDYTTKTLLLEKVRLRARVSMEVDGHLPDLCSPCQRPDGSCGVALRCLCHPKECKNKVVTFGTKSRALSGNSNTQLVPLFSIALFLIM